MHACSPKTNTACVSSPWDIRTLGTPQRACIHACIKCMHVCSKYMHACSKCMHACLFFSAGRTVLSVSLDLHRDSFVEFKYIELYRQPKQNALPIPLKRASSCMHQMHACSKCMHACMHLLPGAARRGAANSIALLSLQSRLRRVGGECVYWWGCCLRVVVFRCLVHLLQTAKQTQQSWRRGGVQLSRQLRTFVSFYFAFIFF